MLGPYELLLYASTSIDVSLMGSTEGAVLGVAVTALAARLATGVSILKTRRVQG